MNTRNRISLLPALIAGLGSWGDGYRPRYHRPKPFQPQTPDIPIDHQGHRIAAQVKRTRKLNLRIANTAKAEAGKLIKTKP